MKRKLYLEGEMAEKFGSELTVNVDNIQDSLKLLQANFPEFRSYLISCAEKDVGFIIDVADKNIENEEDMILPLREGDITITPVPAGSKSGGAKILAAAFLIIATAGIGLAAAGVGVSSTVSALGFQAALIEGLTLAGTWGLAAMGVALNLAMTGIQQLMAPDPSVDSDAPQSYLFNGSQQNTLEGDPVPVLYGELRVPGRPISFGVVNNARVYSSIISLGDGAEGDGTAVPTYEETPDDAENPDDYEKIITAFVYMLDEKGQLKLVPVSGTSLF